MELLVRLKDRRNGPVNYICMGVHFVAGRWTRIPSHIDNEGQAFAFGDYLRGLRANDADLESPLLFDVVDEAKAREIEAAEIEAAERKAAAASVIPGTVSQIDRAVRAAVAPAKEEQLAPEAQPQGERRQFSAKNRGGQK